MRRACTVVFIFSLAYIFSIPNAFAQRQAYKCVDADGSVSYQQTPCSSLGPHARQEVIPVESSEFVGERVSTNFVDVPLLSVLQLFLGDLAGLNIRARPEVANYLRSTPVTVVQENRPWDEILWGVLNRYNLSLEIIGSDAIIDLP